MDQSFGLLPSPNPNPYRCIMCEATTPNSPAVPYIDVPAPHSIATRVDFIGLNEVSHYFYVYELIDGELGQLLSSPPYLVQSNKQDIAGLPDLEINVGVDVDPNQPDYDGTAAHPELKGLVAGVNYMIEQRGVNILKYSEFADIGDPTKIGFSLLGGKLFEEDDTYFLRFIPQISTQPNGNSGTGNGNGYADIVELNTNTTLTSLYLNKLIDINSNTTKISIVLDAVANWPDMRFIGFKTDRGNQINAVITAAGGDLIYFNGAEVNDMVMGKGEHLRLIKKGNHLHVDLFDGDYGRVGMTDFGYLQGRNQIQALGQELQRDVYVRATRLVLSLSPGNGVVSEIVWQTGEESKAAWSTGNGTTTIRVPDLRGMFPRWLPMAKTGIDQDRITASTNAIIASRENEQFKSHRHAITALAKVSLDTDDTSNIEVSTAGSQRDIVTDLTGGTETRPVNIGFLPLINI